MEPMRGAQSNRLFIPLPSTDSTCSCCHTLLPAHHTCYHGNCDGFQLLPWQRWSTPFNLQRHWHLLEAKGHSELWKGSGVYWLAQWPVIIHQHAEEQTLSTQVQLEALHYLLSCDLRIIEPISNVWPGSSFHAVVVFTGPCLSSARGVGKGWAVWYVCPRPLFEG